MHNENNNNNYNVVSSSKIDEEAEEQLFEEKIMKNWSCPQDNIQIKHSMCYEKVANFV